ncbi:acyltransferase [Methanomethylovorans sp.]|uniref:acyltransferase n=1 Tax=Methanomethylovorans sp. TaxID=2758717 RepID=UPI00351C8973
MTAMKNDKAIIGKNSNVQAFVEIGIYPAEGPATIIGDNATIRSHSVIYGGNKIGDKFQTGHGVLIREGNIIGDNVSIGSHSVVERENHIGNNVRIHSNCFIPEFVIIEDNVWIGPSTTILNVLHPPCPRFEDCAKNVTFKSGVKIGGNVTIGPRVTIGENSLIGMGSVVTKDIPPNVLAYGNPAHVVCSIDEMKCEVGYFTRPYEWLNE